jgi:hypothetical protein
LRILFIKQRVYKGYKDLKIIENRVSIIFIILDNYDYFYNLIILYIGCPLVCKV